MYLIIIKFQVKLEETGFDSFLKSEISEFVGPIYEFSYFFSYTSRYSYQMSTSSLFIFKPLCRILTESTPWKRLASVLVEIG